MDPLERRWRHLLVWTEGTFCAEPRTLGPEFAEASDIAVKLHQF